MKIVFFGAGGTLGSRILNEALSRGHTVTVVARNPEKFLQQSRNTATPAGDYVPGQPVAIKGSVTVIQGDALLSKSIAAAAIGHDAAISSIGGDPAGFKPTTAALIEGLTRAGVKRLLCVGGAGSLEVAPGVQLVDAPGFPEAYRATSEAHREVLNILKANTSLDWTYVSPAAVIFPGERTGQFRLGGDQLLADEKGESRISAEDYAIAFINELEQPKHLRQRFTVAY
ncbi:MAG TPA: NAD(P)-dependent oxidoreductase [Verrucomicrobium sp.]|nr:NAD(P)-dependent oxidoreductase [Verrucomicrobium sp.]